MGNNHTQAIAVHVDGWPLLLGRRPNTTVTCNKENKTMSEEHSPGPWRVGWHDRGHGHGDYGVIGGEDEQLIAKVVTGLRVDADILATALELLAACKAVLEYENYDDDYPEELLKAVIAKAEGKEAL